MITDASRGKQPARPALETGCLTRKGRNLHRTRPGRQGFPKNLRACDGNRGTTCATLLAAISQSCSQSGPQHATESTVQLKSGFEAMLTRFPLLRVAVLALGILLIFGATELLLAVSL